MSFAKPIPPPIPPPSPGMSGFTRERRDSLARDLLIAGIRSGKHGLDHAHIVDYAIDLANELFNKTRQAQSIELPRNFQVDLWRILDRNNLLRECQEFLKSREPNAVGSELVAKIEAMLQGPTSSQDVNDLTPHYDQRPGEKTTCPKCGCLHL